MPATKSEPLLISIMSHSILFFAFLLTLLLTTDAAGAQPLPPVKDLPKRGTTLPDPLTMLDGTRIATADQWNKLRKPELRTLFQHYMYGYFPPPPQKIDFTVDLEDKSYFSGKATKKQITIRYFPTAPAINLLLIVPNAEKPSPVFLGINFCGNHTLLDDPTIPLPTAWMPEKCGGIVNNKATDAGRGRAWSINEWNVRMIIDRGYAFANFYHGDIDPDKPDFSDGIHPHFLKPGQTQRGPHDWGTLAAWAWGIHRAVDYLHQDKDIDTTRIAVIGHSRNGKAAILAAAFDERIDLVIPHQAGCGGTAPSRTKNPWAETVKIINGGHSHWFNDTFQLFNDDVDKLPFDQHCLFALCAPAPFSSVTLKRINKPTRPANSTCSSPPTPSTNSSAPPASPQSKAKGTLTYTPASPQPANS